MFPGELFQIETGNLEDLAPFAMIGMMNNNLTGSFEDGFVGFIYEFEVYPYSKNEFEICDQIEETCDGGCSICPIAGECLPFSVI